MPLIRKITLFPFTLLYGLAVALRKGLYGLKIYKRISFDFPIISVGNLSTGGTGKTPHIEFLIRFLITKYKPATLSRGYGRKTKGFRFVNANESFTESGDEPAQLKHKFPELTVAVGENRVLAIPEIIKHHPETDVLLLDDAFQHLPILPGINILLSEYEIPFFNDMQLPSGNLRESRKAAHRANIILITKCPDDLGEKEMQEIKGKIKRYSKAPVFFTNMIYGKAYNWFSNETAIDFLNNYDNLFLVCGIARPGYLIRHLKQQNAKLETRVFNDHHAFSTNEINAIMKHFKSLPGDNNLLLTTEKDAIRLMPFQKRFEENKIDLFCIPVETGFLKDEAGFCQIIETFIQSFKKQ
jgi:tetraacyldisaccharide 4'-kinase